MRTVTSLVRLTVADNEASYYCRSFCRIAEIRLSDCPNFPGAKPDFLAYVFVADHMGLTLIGLM